ncbi:MAG: acriflavin resistance protein [Candidatus Eremiobacteraeota bacterium]|nr:acriflavin resistance protein [Candidatus Eremiobacteraeota bacterium]
MFLTRFCLRNPIVVTLFYAFIGAAGLLALARMGRSVLPPIAFGVVTVTAPYPGAGPAEIERLVIEPIEDRLDGIPGLDRVSASAQDGAARIAVRFRFGIAIDVARAQVQQAVDAARSVMPPDLVPPLVSRDDPSQPPILEEAISSAVLSQSALAELTERTILPAVRATTGVGGAVASGELVRRITIEPRSQAMSALGATVLDLERAVAQQEAVLPGGRTSSGAEQRSIGIGGGAASVDALRALPVALPGSDVTVRAGDLASVRDGFADPTVVTRVDGAPAILLVAGHAPGADAQHAIAALRRTFARLSARAPLVRFEELRTDAPFADAAVGGVLQTIGEGVVLTVIVMLLFLRAWRASLVAAIAIPASLAAAFATMWAAGFTMNVLSLMGLSLTIGILVDDSIVIIEAIAHAVRRGLRGEAAALAGRRELGAVAFAITFVDVAVFAPIAFTSGLIGEFMRQFALVVVFATAFSLLVSFTLTPLLAARWAVRDGRPPLEGTFGELFEALRRTAPRLPWTMRAGALLALAAGWQSAFTAFGRWETRATRAYAERWLPFARRRRGALLSLAAAMCALSFVPLLSGAIPSEFSPPIARGEVTVDLAFPAGTTLAHAGAATQRIAARLLDDPAIAHVVTSAGRAFNGSTDVLAPNVAQVSAILAEPNADGAAVIARIKALGSLAPDATFAGAGTGMGGRPPVSYALSGPPGALDAAAAKLARTIAENPLATDVRLSSGGLAPQLQIDVNDPRAVMLGVSTGDAAQTARIATAGALALRMRLASGLVDVVVLDRAAERGDIEALRHVAVRSAGGRLVPLRAVADFTDRREPTLIEREDRERIVTVSANTLPGVPIGLVTGGLRAALRTSGFLPPGVHLVARGDVEQFLDAVGAILTALGLSVVVVYATLAVLYRSYVVPLVIMATVPLASVGAFGSLFALSALHGAFPGVALFAGQTLNLYSMLGIVMLVGLVAKNGILLIEHAERDVRAGADPFDAVCAAGARRLRPIVMTTAAMIAGMLPLALGDAIGAEYRKALGSVVIGGLASSLVLTLFVVPLVYVSVRRARREGASETLAEHPSYRRAYEVGIGRSS